MSKKECYSIWPMDQCRRRVYEKDMTEGALPRVGDWVMWHASWADTFYGEGEKRFGTSNPEGKVVAILSNGDLVVDMQYYGHCNNPAHKHMLLRRADALAIDELLDEVVLA